MTRVKRYMPREVFASDLGFDTDVCDDARSTRFACGRCHRHAVDAWDSVPHVARTSHGLLSAFFGLTCI